jgi:hypothetical protein
VLYDFEEGEGEIVHDTCEAGERLHLRIEDASVVRWENGGLTFVGPTMAVAELPARRLAEALAAAGAAGTEAAVVAERGSGALR